MSKCNIDHSQEAVVEKLNSQKEYLTSDSYYVIKGFLSSPRSQETLNELFHLLKKYDLASPEEQLERDKKMDELLK
ncbi:group-specific protein [Virgibacillus sp. MSJ-26]|uniref:group-specific protein n=1 Tax=Virgibacillus sp. MSJ-26 TaxID=2841522 RepID=UPI001C11AEB8|nr:group-specific protein [Virgibacillus sp. MSJ-26]MBU5466836.1 group-specific protein [Virgibacillus sp. MSJ-26]